MNIDTGEIVELPDGISDAVALRRRLVPIDMTLATNQQKREMRVRQDDSILGTKLRSYRSKYVPHVGHKQQRKLDTIIQLLRK